MKTSFSHESRNEFSVRTVLFERASFYSASVTEKRKIVDRTLDVAALDPDLFLKPDVEQELFKLLHKVAQEELGTQSKNVASFHRVGAQ
jgi:hypothetical protein